MPRIFDNIEQKLLPALRETLNVADHADFCVGYFNLRGWKQLDSYVERWQAQQDNAEYAAFARTLSQAKGI
jgi:hypothetical protein